VAGPFLIEGDPAEDQDTEGRDLHRVRPKLDLQGLGAPCILRGRSQAVDRPVRGDARGLALVPVLALPVQVPAALLD
jgi:hypothetical protein